ARARVGATATHLASALEVAAGVQSPDCEPRIAIVSDGQVTRGDASAALLGGRTAGGSRAPRVAWVPLEESGDVDAGVAGFTLPEQVRIKESFDCAVRLSATGKVRGRLLLRA